MARSRGPVRRSMPRRDPVTGAFLPRSGGGGKPRKSRRGRRRAPSGVARVGRAYQASVGKRMEFRHPGSGATLETRVSALEHNQEVLKTGVLSVARVAGQALRAAYGRRGR